MSNVVAKSLRVFVVEDEPLITMTIEDSLEALGCNILGPASNYPDALDMAQSENYDCAILDVNIRGMDIYPVADIVLGRGAPILFTTGYEPSSLPERLRGQTCLPKPYTSGQLAQAIRALGDKSRSL